MEMGADAVAHQIPDHTVAKALGVRLDRRRDLSQVAACLRKPDPLKKALLRYIHQLLALPGDTWPTAQVLAASE